MRNTHKIKVSAGSLDGWWDYIVSCPLRSRSGGIIGEYLAAASEAAPDTTNKSHEFSLSK